MALLDVILGITPNEQCFLKKKIPIVLILDPKILHCKAFYLDYYLKKT
jgi:hypothetical protein